MRDVYTKKQVLFLMRCGNKVFCALLVGTTETILIHIVWWQNDKVNVISRIIPL